MSISEPRPVRCLLLYFSHSGDVGEIVESIEKSVQGKGGEVVRAEIILKDKIGFPWHFWDFLSALPGTVTGKPLDFDLIGDRFHEQFDWIVLGWQVWYLHPSQPIQSFLQSPKAAILRQQQVITVCSCRHMWQQALLDLRSRLHAIGADRKADFVSTHDSHGIISFLTTPVYLLTGHSIAKNVANAGVSKAQDLAENVCRLMFAKDRGRSTGSLKQVPGSIAAGSSLDANFLIAEVLGLRFMRFWGTCAAISSRIHPRLAKPILLMFILTLALLIPLALIISFSGRWLWQAFGPSSFERYLEKIRD